MALRRIPKKKIFFRRALGLDPNFYMALSNREALINKGKLTDAAEYYQQD